MLFPPRYRSAIADGSITLTFRRWKRAQALPGRRYRTAAGMIEVEEVDVVDPSSITEADARCAGFDSVAALLSLVGADVGDPVYRVRFHAVVERDPRDVLAYTAELSDADVEEIDRRLERLDRAAAGGPWTAATLALIAERPAVRAADLAAVLGRERAPFKLDVRKLKALGLTLSLDVGYRLSPRGAAYLGRTERPALGPG